MKTPHAISSSIFPVRSARPRDASPSSAPARNAAAICRQRVPFPVAFSSSNGQAASPTAPAAIASFNPIRTRTRPHLSPHPSQTQQSTTSHKHGRRVLTASSLANLIGDCVVASPSSHYFAASAGSWVSLYVFLIQQDRYAKPREPLRTSRLARADRRRAIASTLNLLLQVARQAGQIAGLVPHHQAWPVA